MTYPISSGLHRLNGYINAAAMLVWLVDSVGAWWLPSRSTTGWVAVAESVFGVRISSAMMNCAVGNTGLMTFTNHTSGTGVWTRCESANSWTLDNSDTFGLPIQMGSIDGAAGVTLGSAMTGANLRTLTWEWNDGFMTTWGKDGATWLRTGSENMVIRPLYHMNSPVSQIPSNCRVYDDDLNTTGNMTLRTHGRQFWSEGGDPTTGIQTVPTEDQVNAWYQDWVIPGNTNPDKWTLTFATSLTLACRVWGAMCYRENAATSGYGMIVIGDSSWDYSFHGDDTHTTAGSKRYTNDEARYLLDSCILSRTQPLVVIVHVASENKTVAQIKDRVMGDGGSNQGILVKYRAILDAIGVTNYRFLLVGCWRQHFGGTLAEADAINDANQQALYEVARDDPNRDVAFVSLLKVLGGNLFMADDPTNTSTNGVVPTGTQAASKVWLAARGYNTFALGTSGTHDLTNAATFNGVLTSDGTHQGTSGSGSANVIAAMFMHAMARHIRVALDSDSRGNCAFRSTRHQRIGRAARI